MEVVEQEIGTILLPYGAERAVLDSLDDVLQPYQIKSGEIWDNLHIILEPRVLQCIVSAIKSIMHFAFNFCVDAIDFLYLLVVSILSYMLYQGSWQ